MARRNLSGVAVVSGALWLALAGRATADFAVGDFVSSGQGAWGGTPAGSNPAALLQANYDEVYASTSGVLEVGLPGSAGFSIRFTSASALLNYLPASGPIGPLTGEFLNPLHTMAGEFGGHATALRLNVDFSDAGLLVGNAGIPYGDLELHGFTAQPSLNGLKIRQFLGQVETLLGGGSASYPLAEIGPIAADLTVSFELGGVSPFARDHLRIGFAGFAAGDFTTHTQATWGVAPATGNAAELLSDQYDEVYEDTAGVFTLGRFGPIHFAMQFDSAGALAAYLPAAGQDMRLSADHLNPTSTNAGGFGGEVAALKLNIDFADAGLLPGDRGVAFGDLELVGLKQPEQTQFNGLSVRDFFASASSTLGTNGIGHDVSHYNAITEQLNASFANGGVTPWARNHLRIVDLLPGDYNFDGVVDAADYTVWRDTNVTQARYREWKANFGRTAGGDGAGSLSPTPTPEPAAWMLALAFPFAMACRRIRR